MDRRFEPNHDRGLAGERILVTGGGGFIAKHLIGRLARGGADVIATVRPGAEHPEAAVEVAELDLTDGARLWALIEADPPDRVINLARGRAEHTPAERAALLAETLGITVELIEAASAAGCKQLLQLGSATEYGRAAPALEESRPPAPETLFGAAKAAATQLCLAASRAGRLPATVLRPFIVYGPGDRPERLIGCAIEAAIGGGELPLTGEMARRDWVYVDDVVDACMLALDGRADGEVVNLATGVEHSNEEVVAEVAAALGRPVRIAATTVPPRPWDAARWSGSTAKAERMLGWTARTTLAVGIREILAAERSEVR